MATTEEQVTVIHSDEDGVADYAITVTCVYSQEGSQWVGICEESGTSAFADSLEQTRIELVEAIELQLSEVERLGFADEYLAENSITPVRFDHREQSRFAVVNRP